MREKTCVICEEVFNYKNKTKKYCSNACKQQALRNRKKVNIQVNDGLRSADNTVLINQVFNNCIKQTLAMVKGMSIHHSMLTFMRRTIGALRLAAKVDNKLRNRLERMQGLINELHQIALKDKCEYGYITFDKNTTGYVTSTINHIRDLRSKDGNKQKNHK